MWQPKRFWVFFFYIAWECVSLMIADHWGHPSTMGNRQCRAVPKPRTMPVAAILSQIFLKEARQKSKVCPVVLLPLQLWLAGARPA